MSYNVVSFRHLQDNPNSLIQEADSYFDSLELGVSGELDPNIQDSYGLVSYIVATTNPPPAEIKILYDEIVPIMEGLLDAVVSAVLNIAGNDDQKKHAPATWKGPMSSMCRAFCGIFKEGQIRYDKNIRGTEIEPLYLSLLLEGVVNDGAVYQSFGSYLLSEGNTMQNLAPEQGNGYLYAIISIVHKIFQTMDGQWIYAPEFKAYFPSEFSPQTFKITRGCDSKSQFKFQFDINMMSGSFMIETWKISPDFQEKVRNFIKKYKKTSIKSSENYFEGIFESTQE